MNDEKSPDEGWWFVAGVIAFCVPAACLALLIALPVLAVLAAIVIGIARS